VGSEAALRRAAQRAREQAQRSTGYVMVYRPPLSAIVQLSHQRIVVQKFATPCQAQTTGAQ